MGMDLEHGRLASVHGIDAFLDCLGQGADMSVHGIVNDVDFGHLQMMYTGLKMGVTVRDQSLRRSLTSDFRDSTRSWLRCCGEEPIAGTNQKHDDLQTIPLYDTGSTVFLLAIYRHNGSRKRGTSMSICLGRTTLRGQTQCMVVSWQLKQLYKFAHAQ